MFIGRTGDSPSAEEVRKHYAALGADAVTNIELVMKGDQYRAALNLLPERTSQYIFLLCIAIFSIHYFVCILTTPKGACGPSRLSSFAAMQTYHSIHAHPMNIPSRPSKLSF